MVLIAWREEELGFARSGIATLAEESRLFQCSFGLAFSRGCVHRLTNPVWVVMQRVSNLIHPSINDTFLKEGEQQLLFERLSSSLCQWPISSKRKVKSNEGSSVKAQDQRIATFTVEGESA